MGGRVTKSLFVAIIILALGACQTTGPKTPVVTKLDGGITSTILTIPVTEGNYVKAEMFLPPASEPVPGVFVLPTYYVNAFNRPEQFDRLYAIELAKLGYATLIPNLNHHGARAYHPKYGPDILAISQWFRGRPEVMDDRIGSVGFSMGAYHSTRLSTVDPTTRAVIGYYGPYDNSSFTPWSADRDVSSVNTAQMVNGAILLLHGQEDDETRVQMATAYRQKLTEAGKTVELVVYPGDTHRFDRGPSDVMRGADRTPAGNLYRLNPADRDDAWRRTTDWLKKYMY